MTKLSIAILTALSAIGASAGNRTHLLSSDNTSLAITTTDGGQASYRYFGPRINETDLGSILSNGHDALPQFGIHGTTGAMLKAKMPDGSVNTDLRVDSAAIATDSLGQRLTVYYSDPAYPQFKVRQHFRAYEGTDVFATQLELSNSGKKGNIELIQFASACVPLTRNDNYLTQFGGVWAGESQMSQTPIANGSNVIANTNGLRTGFGPNPGFMVSIDGKATENRGEVFGGNLLWAGNFKTELSADNHSLKVISGINDDASRITLAPGESFTTPELAMAYSTEGKGGVSRAFHKWGRKYGMTHGDRLHDILLNSWEGVYFGINQEVMEQMMTDIAALGGELFVMDDGWFGNKYTRDNDRTSLGDWAVCERKLPQGIKGLTDAAANRGIKFGIWIEPEMVNTKSELYEAHPEWVLSQPNRRLTTSRGGTQAVLDLCNPKVQDFVFSVTDNLLSQHPEIAYIKWDCNSDVMNYSSPYLPKDRQEELFVRFNQGLIDVMKRIREKYPDVAIQLCSSGGARVNYGLLPWFDEVWVSDNTDAMQRVFIQWGDSHFYPAIAQASHVSASPNHQTGRRLPLKFRFDVAMSGRLGMEIQPKNMNEQELEFSKRAIEAYKRIRPVVQFGEQYRLLSPYEGPVAALMYADDTKDNLVLFAYRMNYLHNQGVPPVRLDGVDENKTYRIHDLTPSNPSRPCNLDGKLVSGRILKHMGLDLSNALGHPDASVALELTAE